MNTFDWIQLIFSLLAIAFGVIVLRGVLRGALQSKWTRLFLKYSLIASLAGLMPLTRHLTLTQDISMLSVYCSAAVILAWFKFHLIGRWRAVFGFLLTIVLYLNVVSLSILLFKYFSFSPIAALQSVTGFEIAQSVLAAFFAVMGVLTLRSCHPIGSARLRGDHPFDWGRRRFRARCI